MKKLQKPKITCIERTHCRKTKTVEDFGIVGLESMFALLQIRFRFFFLEMPKKVRVGGFRLASVG